MVDVKKAAVEKSVEQRTKYLIEMYGGTLFLDGWSDITIKPLINIMLVCRVADVFQE